MKIDILTLFPDMFNGPFDTSMLKKAKDKGLVEINIHNLRNWSLDKHNTVDGRPFGGGPGMVIRVDIVQNAISNLKFSRNKPDEKIILLTPQGEVFNQKKALEISKLKRVLLIAGHYEGFDDRIRQHLIDEEISIGKYVLTGGEIPAMAITDAVVRLIPGVLRDESREQESFMLEDEMDYPVFTRPEEFNGWSVPEVLLSGNHSEIDKWRNENKKN